MKIITKFERLFTLSLRTTLLTIFVGMLALPAYASDTEYHYVWNIGDSGPNAPGPFGINNNTGEFENVSFIYDTDLELLSVEFTVAATVDPFRQPRALYPCTHQRIPSWTRRK